MTAKSSSEQPASLPEPWATTLDLSLLACCEVLALLAFWQPGRPIEADFLLDVYRSFSLDQAWQARQLFPRLGMDLNFGYGAPLFQYYPPAGSYVTLAFRWLGLGWVEATKLAFTLALALAGVGAYCYARWLYSDRRAALAAGLAYLLAPYLLFCAYERGALAELLALGLLPWLLWAMHHLLRPASRPWLWPAAAFMALLVLMHNVTALFALPLLAVYLAGMAWREGAWRRLTSAGLAVGLGLGLSAFYWLPALTEGGYAQIERWMLRFDAVAVENLRGFTALIQRSLAFDYWSSWIPALPVLTALLGGIGLVMLIVGNRAQRSLAGLLVILMAIPLFLQWRASRPLYDALPLLRYVQYPWRLLGLMSFFAALLSALFFTWRRLAGAAGWLALGVLASLIAFGSLSAIRPPPDQWPYFGSEQVNLRNHYRRGQTGYWWLYNDYQPAAMKEEAAELAWPGAPDAEFGMPPPQETAPTIRIVADGPADLRLEVESPGPFTLRVPRIFYPGWRAWVDGKPVETRPTGPWGMVTVELPAGRYPVRVRFGETPLRVLANAISLICLVIWSVGLACERRARPFLATTAVILALLAGLSLRHQGLGRGPHHPTAFPVNLQDEIFLLGYELSQRTFRAGDTLSLRLYWLARRTPESNYRVFLHLVTPDDSQRVAQSDEGPNLDTRPTGRWQAGELVIGEQELLLPGDLPPSTYRLLIGMYRAEDVRNLSVRSAPSVLPGDRLDLGLIEVRGAL